ncbi:MAG: AbrB/MazE/SpoVT family DNA-binding domain-containing protein [Desulfobulbaceae bacterium]|nr:AbrB/MazE/SpoVT family DNA-binding domain-containing protein [Desulfobulbaceae bacterium]
MYTVTLSPKFQVVIPKKIRESFQLKPEQKMQVVQYDNRVEFIPEKDVSELQGFLKEINTAFAKNED